MERASDYFGRIAADYDSLIVRAVPRYHEMHAALVGTLPERAERVLELGAGTGNLSVALRQRFPDAELCLVDAAPSMLEVCRNRLGAGPRLRTVASLFEELTLESGSFDLVTSCISLHHVRDKGALFRRIRAWLCTGGAFVYADQMRGGTEHQHERNVAAMLEHWRLPGHLDAREQEELWRHDREHDHHVPVVTQIDLLRESGFGDLDCVWRSGMWGILSAAVPEDGDQALAGPSP